MSDGNDATNEEKGQQIIADGGVSVGTFDDLQPNRAQPVDRNPDVQCHGDGCTNSLTWDRWQEMYHDITPETKLRCNECIGELIEQARVDRRKEQNISLEKWSV